MTNISQQLTNGLHLFRPIIPGLVPFFIDKLRAPGQGLRPSAYLKFLNLQFVKIKINSNSNPISISLYKIFFLFYNL
jgi:hypothetical protein